MRQTNTHDRKCWDLFNTIIRICWVFNLSLFMPPKIQHNTLQSIKILMLGEQTSEHLDVDLHIEEINICILKQLRIF